MWSPSAQSWITLHGKVLVHPNKGELEFLFPGTTVRQCYGVDDDDVMLIADHPQMASVKFPLNRKDFW
jgi:hypothetical protein